MVAQATVQAEDLWYVAIAPGETKVLTLEQLDDWFRLEVIDAETKVWQPGMPEWLPLSVVAGIEEPPTRPAPPAPRRAPNPPTPITTASTLPAPKPPSRPMALSGPPPPPSARVPLPQQRPVAVAPALSPAAAPSLAPAAVVNGPWPVALGASRSPAPIESLRPHVLSERPMAPPRSGGKAGRFVVGLAVFAGVGLTLYRNDLLREAATSAGQATNYQKLESALGGPGFGTPRSVEALVMPASLSEAVRTAQRPVTPRSGSATMATTTSANPGSEQHAGASSNAGSSASGSQSSPSLSSLMAEKLNAKGSAPEPRAKGSAPRAKDAEPAPSTNLGIKGSSNKFDPLNGKL